MKKMAISFSGGRTSAYMTNWLLNNLADEYEFVVTFANTGQEHEKTLEFVRDCDIHFGFNTVWLESVVHHGVRKAPTHKIVNFDTAERSEKLFENAIIKHGIPNMAFPYCTDKLKLAPMKSYLRSIGWKKRDYVCAIGIRADEPNRLREDAVEAGLIYPLAHIIPTAKPYILEWWTSQKFDLGIPEHHGNCTWCWKKTLSKHIKLIGEMPEIYKAPARLEKLYPYTGPHTKLTGRTDHLTSAIHHSGNDVAPRHFFRKNLSTNDLFKLSGLDDVVILDDAISECSESCEVFTK